MNEWIRSFSNEFLNIILTLKMEIKGEINLEVCFFGRIIINCKNNGFPSFFDN